MVPIKHIFKVSKGKNYWDKDSQFCTQKVMPMSSIKSVFLGHHLRTYCLPVSALDSRTSFAFISGVIPWGLYEKSELEIWIWVQVVHLEGNYSKRVERAKTEGRANNVCFIDLITAVAIWGPTLVRPLEMYLTLVLHKDGRGGHLSTTPQYPLLRVSLEMLTPMFS